MSSAVHDGWPPRPTTWSHVMNEVEVCQLLRLDEGRSVAAAKRCLRHIRRTQGLASAGRVGSRLLFRRSTIDAWLAARERAQTACQAGVTTGTNAD